MLRCTMKRILTFIRCECKTPKKKIFAGANLRSDPSRRRAPNLEHHNIHGAAQARFFGKYLSILCYYVRKRASGKWFGRRMGAIDKPRPGMHPTRLPRPSPPPAPTPARHCKKSEGKREKAKATMAGQSAALRPRGRIRGAKARNHIKDKKQSQRKRREGASAPARLGRGCARQDASQRTERCARSMKARNRRNGGEGGEEKKRAATRDALEPKKKTGRPQPIRPERRHISLPPTTKPLETFKVGWPTPTGTDWPFLPHTPIPSSS